MTPSRIANESVESNSLQHNPLGDPTTRTLPVYLPPGYDSGSDTYPVVFLLVGYTGRGSQMLGTAAWEETIQQRMDRLILEKKCQPMLLILPDCFSRYGGAQYLNSSAIGNYQDYILELVDVVDERFRTKKDRNFRAVAGKSSGGFGALTLGMQHSDTFGLIADHSGDKYFEMCYKPDFPKFIRASERFKDAKAFLADPSAIRPRSGDFFNFISLAAMAACYSPNPDAELGFDLPFDLHTGELRKDIWAKWEAHDPINIFHQHADALRSLKLLYFDCGSRDEYNLLYGCRILQKRLNEAKIKHRYEEFNDGHRSIQYRYDVSLAAISDAFQADV